LEKSGRSEKSEQSGQREWEDGIAIIRIILEYMKARLGRQFGLFSAGMGTLFFSRGPQHFFY